MSQLLLTGFKVDQAVDGPVFLCYYFRCCHYMNCPVCHRDASILFDPGSTYSYVSSYFAHYLGTPRNHHLFGLGVVVNNSEYV